MILSETFILACFPWVLLRSTHGYKEMMPCGQLCPPAAMRLSLETDG